MLLFNWSLIFEKAEGNILICNQIMEMIITQRLPKNRYDPIYKYSKTNFIGRSFLLHPDILLFNAYKHDQKDIAIYYALTAMRNIADYRATQKTTLDLHRVPVELDLFEDNKLLHIKDGIIHFIYEEVPKEIIH